MIVFRIMVFAFIAGIPATCFSAMPATVMPMGGGGGQNTMSIFAYPGKDCPGGSVLYKGPETALARETGAVYCEFRKKVQVFDKKHVENCPAPFYREYRDEKLKPDPDVIWCERDPRPVIPPPPPPWVETPLPPD